MQQEKVLTHLFLQHLRLARQNKIEDKMEKKEQDKQISINDVIQLNEEAEMILLLEINRYNEQTFQNTEKLINDVSVQNETLKKFKM